MSDDLAPAIAVFERIIADAERKAAEARSAINALYQARGLPARYADDAGPQGGAGTVASPVPITQIKRDSFYGKKQMTAIRELLEMRRAHGEGPATPREVLDALKAGGYRFEAKSDDIALVGVRALMRKATTVFHKLPGTNAYGLSVWYPNARATKQGAGEANGIQAPASKRGSSKTGTQKPHPTKAKATRAKATASPKRDAAARPQKSAAISTFVEAALADGSDWTTERLLTEAVSRGIDGVTRSTPRNKFQGALMALQKRNRAISLGNGVWKIAPQAGSSPDDGDRVVPIKGVA